MSVVFVVTPMVVAGWPLLCGAVAAAAASMGYKVLAAEQPEQIHVEPTERWIDIPIKDSQVIADSMARESQFTIHNDDITATFTRSADGRCICHVAAENRTDAELQRIGDELIGKVTQQYAYNKVITELKGQGFTITNEEVANDQSIRIRVSKYV